MTTPNLKNYTTKVPAEQTAAEVTGILVRHGARQISQEYDEAQNVVGLSWLARTPYGEIPFRLPVNADRCFKVMLKQRLVRNDTQGMAQARMTAWRITKDWISAQMALIQTEMADLAEVLLPYALVDKDTTVYQRMLAGRFAQLALQAPEEAKR